MHFIGLAIAWLCVLVDCREPRHPVLYYSKYGHNMVYGNHMIKEDHEVDAILNIGHPYKLFFVVERGYSPISVTITPCSRDGLLEWKFSHSIFQNHMDERQSDWSNYVLRPPTSSPAAAYLGHERRTYSNPWAPAGLYTLELRGREPMLAKVFATTRQVHVPPYHPPLPPDSALQIVKVKRNRILVSWKTSLSTRPLRYCVSVNNRGNYNSLCSAEEDTGTALECVGHRTWHLFKGLSRGQTHYFDVFVLDDVTNASSTYVGVSATLHHPQRHHHQQQMRLKEEAISTFTLDEVNGYEVSIKYQLGSSLGPYLLFVQSCTGPGPVNVHITFNTGTAKENVMSTTVLDVKTLTIPSQHHRNVTNSYLTLTMRATTRVPRSVRVWMSGRRRFSPFPTLPEDKSVRVFDTLTTCDSVTIGWKTSQDEKVRYCVYRRAVTDPATHRRLAAAPQDFCPVDGKPTSSSSRQTVLCRRYHKFSKHRFSNLVMQRIKGLRPDTRYLFEVQVSKAKGGMLPYEQVWATTLSACAKSRR